MSICQIAFILFGMLFSLVCHAEPFEVFVGTGPATWSKCGENGCWRQPPLASSWNLHTQASEIGVAHRGWEFAYHDLGEVGVCGTYVSDADYNPHIMVVRPHAQRIATCTTQHTYGFSLRYAPRFNVWGAWHMSPSLGVLRISQTQEVWSMEDGKKGKPATVTWSTHLYNTNRYTPAAGIKVSWQADNLLIGAGAEWFLRPRFRDSLAGGGSESKIGLRVRLLEARLVFRE